jgi:hypothetical protein
MQKTIKIITIVFLCIIAIWFISALITCNHSNNLGAEKPDSTSQQNVVGLNQPLKTKYFEVTIKRFVIRNHINTGNPYLNPPKSKDDRFLILDAKFKNIDTESRTILDGEVLITYNGKDYQFDHSETIMAPAGDCFLIK